MTAVIPLNPFRKMSERELVARYSELRSLLRGDDDPSDHAIAVEMYGILREYGERRRARQSQN